MKSVPRPTLVVLVLVALTLTHCDEPAALPPTDRPAATPTPGPRQAVVVQRSGQVSGRTSPADALAPVAVGYQITGGGEVRTGNQSRARLDLNDGAILRLAANSAFVLRSVEPEASGKLLIQLRDLAGKLWVSLTGGQLEIETPAGVATVRGSFATLQYDGGARLLRFDCLEGQCALNGPGLNVQFGNLQRLVVSPSGVLRQALTPADVVAFLQDNPESQRMVSTLAAAPTPTRPTATPTPSASPSPANTETPTETAAAPAALALGQHTVQRGETLFCIARAYGVLPDAILQANGLASANGLTVGLVLQIPDVPWLNMTAGPACASQFPPKYASAPPPPTSPPVVTAPPPPTVVSRTPGQNHLGTEKVVLADYVMWYDPSIFDGTITWDVPAAGPYNSDDRATIQRQVQGAQQACLNGFSAHWYGPSESRTTANFRTLLSVSAGTALRHAIVIQTNILPGATEQMIIDAINYLLQNWAQQPNYLRLGGRPVIIFTDMPRPWGNDADALAGWGRIRAATDPNHSAIWMAEGLTTAYNPLFDGQYVYRIDHRDFPQSWLKQPRFAGNLRALERQLGSALPLGGLYWADTIAPGFDDTRSVNAPIDFRSSSPTFARDRRDGGYYADTFSVTAQTGGDFLLVKSFNEWIEGTEIEPGQTYGNRYIDLTCQYANTYRSR